MDRSGGGSSCVIEPPVRSNHSFHKSIRRSPRGRAERDCFYSSRSTLKAFCRRPRFLRATYFAPTDVRVRHDGQQNHAAIRRPLTHHSLALSAGRRSVPPHLFAHGAEQAVGRRTSAARHRQKRPSIRGYSTSGVTIFFFSSSRLSGIIYFMCRGGYSFHSTPVSLWQVF